MTLSAPASDPLLDELNGALAKTGDPTEIDRPGDQPKSLAEQLEVGSPSAATSAPKAAQNLDKTFSRARGGYGYRVTVEGEYYAKSKEVKGNVVLHYSIPFNLPALTNQKGDAALGIIVGKLLKPALLKLNPLAVTYRTHKIVKVEPLEGAPPPTSLQYMSIEALSAYVRDNMPDFPIAPDQYWDVNDLREDVIDYKTNQTSEIQNSDGSKTKGGLGIKKTPSERILERHEERKEKRELSAMNDGLEV